MQYSWKQGIQKAVKYFLIFMVSSLPFFYSFIPPEAKSMSLLDVLGYTAPILKTLTVGGVLTLVLNWLKVKQGLKLLD